MMTCETCRNIQLATWTEKHQVAANEGRGSYIVPTFTYSLQKTYTQIVETAINGCNTCRFFVDEITREIPDEYLDEWLDEPVLLDTYYERFELRAALRVEGDARFLRLEPFLGPSEPSYYRLPEVGRIYVSGRYLPKDPSSEESFAWIKALLRDCCDGSSIHTGCSVGFDGPPKLPSRVLDLRVSDHVGDVRLVETHNRQIDKYIALSHRWGEGPQPLVTTSENISSHMRLIRFNDLPESFQDAVEICRRLSVRYLWADTLCILQDSKKDWALEASNMGATYENAYLTLALSAACNSHQRVLQGRLPVPSVELSGDLSDVFLRSASDVNLRNLQHIGDTKHPLRWQCTRDFMSSTWGFSVLAPRGWAYQEALLSRRVLYFTPCQLAWRCEAGGFVESRVMPSSNIARSFRRQTASEQAHAPRSPADVVAAWSAYVYEFSGLELTFAADKLVAFSGIARRTALLLRDEYVAGLWRKSLLYLLLWRVKYAAGNSRPATYRSPSWSWAAIDGHVYHPSNHGSVDLSRPSTHELRVNKVFVKLASPDVYGAVESAELSVRAFCVELKSVNGLPEFSSSPGDYGFFGSYDFSIDIASELPDCGVYSYETGYTYMLVGLRFRELSYGESTLLDPAERTYGLLLTRIKSSGHFRRVGVLSISDEILNREKWIERDLTLI